jgi:hypothetical protein
MTLRCCSLLTGGAAVDNLGHVVVICCIKHAAEFDCGDDGFDCGDDGVFKFIV